LQQGMQQGLQQGMQKGEDVFAQLMQKLFALGRTEDAKKAAEDRDYRHKLMEEFNLAE
jgi:flagellar biosynthesis/type III secretory pathway protein FliH